MVRRSTIKLRHVVTLFVLSALAFPPGCGGDGDGPAAVLSPLQSSQKSFSGTILQPNGMGLPGVTVTVGNPTTAVTDANGNFIIQDVASGMVNVEIDGTTATVPGASFPVLDVVVDIAAEGATVLPQSITLPDLNNPDSATASASVDADGAATADFQSIAGTNPDIQLSGTTGTVIKVGGVVPAGSVNLTVTPVPANQVPMPLPGQNLDASSFVTIQPANVSFVSSGGQGIDIVLPNLRGFPISTPVAIWSFDHDVGDWVNRSLQTGNQGIVISASQIEGIGVITKGGWHAAVIPVNTNCATTLTGRVVDGATPASGIPDVRVSLSTGQFATTDASGNFSIGSVPAYVVADLPTCTPIDVTANFLTPVAFGAVSASQVVLASQVVPAGTTDMGDIVVTVPTTGSLSGLVTDNGLGVSGAVTITGPTSTTAMSSALGGFFVTGLAPGSYTASFQFTGAPGPTVGTFTIVANQTTTINIQRTAGTGNQNVTVLVLFDDDDDTSTPMMPGDGARVALVGTDAASSGGILAVCNSQGQATFNAVTGPFTVTAQLDVTRPSFSPGLPPRLTRTGVTLVNLPAPSGTIGMPIFGFDFQPVTVDATIDGTVMNLPTLGAGEELVVDVSISSGGLFFNQTQVNPMDGSYSLAIPSGIPVNATLIHRDGFCTTLSILSVRGVGPAAPGGSITQNFDAASSAVVPFDHAVNMTYNNALPTGPNTSSSGGLCLDENGSEIACFCLFDAGSGPLPATVMIPDPADPNLAGLQLSLDVNQNVFQIVLGQGPEVNCELVLTGSPTALTFDFPGVPTVNAPTQGATLMVSEAATMAVDFTEGTGGLASGLNFVDIESGSGMTLNGVLAGRIAGLGVDEVEWCIFLPVGTSSLTLPRTAQDVFAPGAYTLKAEQFRSDQTIIYNSFFNENVEQNLNNLIDSLQSDCDADSEEIVFTVVADMPAP